MDNRYTFGQHLMFVGLSIAFALFVLGVVGLLSLREANVGLFLFISTISWLICLEYGHRVLRRR